MFKCTRYITSICDPNFRAQAAERALLYFCSCTPLQKVAVYCCSFVDGVVEENGDLEIYRQKRKTLKTRKVYNLVIRSIYKNAR